MEQCVFKGTITTVWGCSEYAPPPKPTHYDHIMADMTVEKMAELNIVEDNTVDSDGTVDHHYGTSDNSWFADRDDAVTYEIDWLKGVDE
jgi:hypothetical protein